MIKKVIKLCLYIYFISGLFVCLLAIITLMEYAVSALILRHITLFGFETVSNVIGSLLIGGAVLKVGLQVFQLLFSCSFLFAEWIVNLEVYSQWYDYGINNKKLELELPEEVVDEPSKPTKKKEPVISQQNGDTIGWIAIGLFIIIVALSEHA